MRFVPALPEGWTQQELPACSLPGILAALTEKDHTDLETFCLAARQQAFTTALVDAHFSAEQQEDFLPLTDVSGQVV